MKTIHLTDSEMQFLKERLYSVAVANPKSVSKSILKKLNKERAITRRSAKQKGLNLQKWACQKLADLIGIEYNQSDDQCEIHSRESGQHGRDIILRGTAKMRLPFSFECKNTEYFNFNDSVQQAIQNQEKGTDWVVVHKNKELKNPVVTMDWNVFERYIKLNLLDNNLTIENLK